MIFFLSGSAIAVLVMLLVFGVGGATYVLSDALGVIVSHWPVLLVVLAIVSLLTNVFTAVASLSGESDAGSEKEPGFFCSILIATVGSAGDFIVSLGFSVVALTEMQMVVNGAEENLIGFAILFALVGWIEILLLFLGAAAASLFISYSLIYSPIRKLIVAILYLILCSMMMSSLYPTAFADIFLATPIGFYTEALRECLANSTKLMMGF